MCHAASLGRKLTLLFRLCPCNFGGEADRLLLRSRPYHRRCYFDPKQPADPLQGRRPILCETGRQRASSRRHRNGHGNRACATFSSPRHSSSLTPPVVLQRRSTYTARTNMSVFRDFRWVTARGLFLRVPCLSLCRQWLNARRVPPRSILPCRIALSECAFGQTSSLGQPHAACCFA